MLCRRGRQTDPQQRLNLPPPLWRDPLQEKRYQIILPGLPEDHPVDGEGPLERVELRFVPAQLSMATENVRVMAFENVRVVAAENVRVGKLPCGESVATGAGQLPMCRRAFTAWPSRQ